MPSISVQTTVNKQQKRGHLKLRVCGINRHFRIRQQLLEPFIPHDIWGCERRTIIFSFECYLK